jgi:Lar family restriction alleviation protein
MNLLPCPFCGTKDIALGSFNGTFYNYCTKCAIEGPWVNSVEEADKIWNTRWVPQEKPTSP